MDRPRIETSEIIKRQPPKVTFIFTTHAGSEDAYASWEKARGADLLLMENTAIDAKSHQLIDKILFESGRTGSFLTGNEISKRLGSNFGKTLAKLAGDIKMGFVDVRPNWKGYSNILKEEKLLDKASTSIQNANYPTALNYFKQSIYEGASRSYERNLIVAKQVRGIIEKHAMELAGKSIAVVQGASHSETARTFESDYPEIPSKHVFTKTAKQNTLVFKAYNLAIVGEKEKADEAIKRYFLSEYVIQRLLENQNRYQENLIEKSDKIAAELTPNQIENIFADLYNSGRKIQDNLSDKKNRAELVKNHSENNLLRIAKNILVGNIY